MDPLELVTQRPGGVGQEGVIALNIHFVLRVAVRAVVTEVTAGRICVLVLRIAANIVIQINRRIVGAVVIPKATAQVHVLPRVGGHPQIDQRGVDLAVERVPRQRVRHDQAGIDRIREEVLVLKHPAVGEVEIHPRAGLGVDVVAAREVDLMELVVRRKPQLAKTGRIASGGGPCPIRKGVLPDERAVLIVEQRDVIGQLPLQPVIGIGERHGGLIGQIVDGLGKENGARVAAGVANHRPDRFQSVLPLVLIVGAELPFRRDLVLEAPAHLFAIIVEIDRVEIRNQVGHSRRTRITRVGRPVRRQRLIGAARADHRR